MMYENIITNVREITEKFTDINPFYVFLAPKDADSAAGVVVMRGILTYEYPKNDDSYHDIPFTVGTWNPLAMNYLDVTADITADYRVFIGYVEI